MDAKSELQQKVLALKRGYTAGNIKYTSSRTEHDKWRASLSISRFEFPITGSFNSKRSAETAAAQNILDSWPRFSKVLLKRRRKKNSKYSFCEAEEEKRWNLNEESSSSSNSNNGLSQAEYAEIGYHTYALHLLMQKKT